jgi:hypothetical protein
MRFKRRSIVLAILCFIALAIYVDVVVLATVPRPKSIDTSHLVNIDYVHMEPGSFHLFVKHVMGKRNYLEWGAGGSTQFAPFIVSGKAYSVEHVPEWCYHLRSENTLIKSAVELGKLEIICVHHQISLGDWGYPSRNASLVDIQGLQRKYVNAAGVNKFDFVLIDGRFRVACALSLLLKDMLNDGSKVMIHDFHQRPQYEVILDFYDVVEPSSDRATAIILSPKATIDENSLLREYQLHEFDYQ